MREFKLLLHFEVSNEVVYFQKKTKKYYKTLSTGLTDKKSHLHFKT